MIGAARRDRRIPDVADEVVALDGDRGAPGGDCDHRRALGRARRARDRRREHGVRVVQLGQSAGATATLRSDWVRGKDANILGPRALLDRPR